jgi:hypothetical protein
MSGPVESLNVSVAAAVFLYELRRQRDGASPVTAAAAADAARASAAPRAGKKPL